MTNIKRYEELCQQNDMPVFMQYWWLDAVSAGKDWDVLLVHEDNDETKPIIAAMPYEYRKMLWGRIAQPQEMTPYGGIWFSPEVNEQEQLQLVGTRIQEMLKEKRVWSFNQRFQVGSPMPKMLEEMGFRISRRRTFVLDHITSMEDIRNGFSRNKRHKLDTLTSGYTIRDVDPEEFYRFHHATCLQKRLRIEYSREMLLVLWEKARNQQQGETIGIYTDENELLAAAFVVWDKSTLYELINTFDHDHPDNGAREMLAYEIIRRAYEKGLQINFNNHRDYLKHYGAKAKPFASVYAGSVTHTWYRRVTEWVSLQLKR